MLRSLNFKSGLGIGTLALAACASFPASGHAQGLQKGLDQAVRLNVLDVVKSQQEKSFQNFQKNPADITYSQAKAGIRPDITPAEFDKVVDQTKNFYDKLKVNLTIQVFAPNKIDVVSFDCVPQALQPGLTGSLAAAAVIKAATPPPDPEAPPMAPAAAAPAPVAPPAPTFANPAVKVTTAEVPACPLGTVPIPRISAAEAMAPGFKNSQRNGAPVLDTGAYRIANGNAAPPPAAAPEHRWAHAMSKVTNHGAAARLNVWSPRVVSGDMSLSQIWVVAGTVEQLNLQTVEAGWQVMSLWQTPFSTVFVFSSSDMYGPGSCYATRCSTFYDPPRAESFVLTTNKIVIGKPISVQSVVGGVQSQIDVKWVRKVETGDWWLQVDGDWIGYYPVASFKGGPLSNAATHVDFGGETTGILATSEMGSGRHANEGPGMAAYQSRLRYFDTTDHVVEPNVVPVSTSADCYTIIVGGPNAPEADAGTFFYFGGPGTGHFWDVAPDPSGGAMCRQPKKPK